MHPAQILRSWYIFFMQLPWLPEFLLLPQIIVYLTNDMRETIEIEHRGYLPGDSDRPRLRRPPLLRRQNYAIVLASDP